MSKVHSNSVTQGQGEYIKYVFVYKKDKHGFVNYFLLRALLLLIILHIVGPIQFMVM